MSFPLYESYAPERQELGPARVTDVTYTITVTLAAGKAALVKASAFDPATGADITKAASGQIFSLYISIRNDGDKDTLWITAKDKDTGTIIKNTEGTACDFSVVVDAGKIWGLTFPLVKMPAKNYNILVEAGHGAA